MKRMVMFFVASLLVAVSFFGSIKTKIAKAYDIDFSALASDEYLAIIKDGDLLRFYDRTAGTEGEKQFALYLQQKFLELGYKLNGTDSVNAAFEPFVFTSLIDGQEKQSQNIKFIKEGTVGQKKIIICTSYDNAFGFTEDQAAYEAIGEDAGLSKVVAAITIATAIKNTVFDYDIEFVFLGAECHDFAGGKNLALGIGEREANDILLAINIDDIVDGSLFYYDAEVDTKYGLAFSDYANESGDIEILKYKAGNSVILSGNDYLPYTHRALMSSNAALLNSGIRTISILGCSKTGVFGNEYYRDYELEAFDGSNIPDSVGFSAAKVAKVVSNFVQDKNIEELAIGNVNVSKYLTDSRYVALLLVTIIVIMWIVYFVVYKNYLIKLKKRYTSKTAAKEMVDILDKEINNSNDPEIKLMKDQIKEVFGKKIEEKFDDEDENKN